MSHFKFSFSALASLALLVPSTVHAADPTAAPAAAAAPATDPAAAGSGNEAAAEPSSAALDVHLKLTDSKLQEAQILEALEDELEVPVRLSEADHGLYLDVSGQKLEARYVPSPGKSVQRELELPADPARQLDTIVLLAGNLVRDEAGRLLAELRAVPPPVPAPEGETPPGEPAPAAPPEPPAEPKEEPEPQLPLAAANFTVFSPVSTHPELYAHETNFSLGLFYTDVGRINGFALNGFATRNRTGGNGFQMSGIWNGTEGRMRGVNLAGLVSTASGGHEGLQIAGLFAGQTGNFKGVQLSLVNVVGGETRGPQVGLINSSAQSFAGPQVGLVNVADEVKGIQVGLVNVSNGKVHGAQIGLVNIGGGMKGAPLGLININPDVRMQAVAWGSVHFEQGATGAFSAPFMGHVGLKYLSNHFYSLVGFGLSSQSSCPSNAGHCGDAVMAPSVAFGVHVDLSKAVYFEADGQAQWEFSAETGDYGTQAFLLRPQFGWAINEKLAVFAGGGPRLDVDPADVPADDPSTIDWALSPHFFAGLQLF